MDPATGPDGAPLPPEIAAIADGDFDTLKTITSALLHRLTQRMPAEDPAGFARAVQNGK